MTEASKHFYSILLYSNTFGLNSKLHVPDFSAPGPKVSLSVDFIYEAVIYIYIYIYEKTPADPVASLLMALMKEPTGMRRRRRRRRC